MKKSLLIIAVFCSLFSMQLRAQECKICGDWVGVFEGSKMHPSEDRTVSAEYKLYIRIKKVDDNFIVRVKDRLADGSSEFVYAPECIVQNVTQNKISWYWDWGEDDNGGYGWGTEKGVKIAYVHCISYVSATLNNGILYYDGGKEVCKQCDRNGNVVSQYEKKNLYPTSSRVALYKDDDDW